MLRRLSSLVTRRVSTSICWVGEELIDDLKFSRSERDGGTVYCGAHGVLIKHQVADGQLLGRCDLRPPQKRLKPQDELFQVHGLAHIVVDAQSVPLCFGGEVVARSHKQNGDILINGAHRSREFKAVDVRHHNVRNDEIEFLLFHRRKCLICVELAYGLIAVSAQVFVHRLIEVGDVLYN